MNCYYLEDLGLPTRYEIELQYVVNELIDNAGESIKQIILFGSAARNELKSGSDLNVLVIPLVDSERKKLSMRIADLDLSGVIPVDITVRTQRYMNNMDEAFPQNIKKDGKVLWTNERV